MKSANKKHIHFIGIGGIGISALARFYVHEGAVVTGSDRVSSIVTEGLEKLGIVINYDQENTSIYSSISQSDCPIDMVVYTEAMSEDHPEMVAAKALGVPMMNYFEALGNVSNEYYLIAVAGTHGKTTTTAMITDILEEAGLDPTAIIGSLRSKTKSNFRAGKSKYAVVEACEYKRDFLHLTPDVLVITNLEYEHVDYYQSLADVQDAFRKLALQVREGGVIVTDTANPNITPVIKDFQNDGHPITVIDYRTQLDLMLSLRQPGVHNRLNAAAAKAAAVYLDIESSITTTALENFAGTWRRFEYKGDVIPVTGGKVPVYDDYGHHPTELSVTFGGARELHPASRLVVVFQPHTYSRTHALFADFVDALTLADYVYLLPIYAAREENTWGVTSEQILKALIKRGTPTELFQTPPALATHLKATVIDDDMIVVIGAGAVTEVAKELTN